jgi:hypothetical protein
MCATGAASVLRMAPPSHTGKASGTRSTRIVVVRRHLYVKQYDQRVQTEQHRRGAKHREACSASRCFQTSGTHGFPEASSQSTSGLFRFRGSNCIPMATLAIDLCRAMFIGGVVTRQRNGSLGTERFDHQRGQNSCDTLMPGFCSGKGCGAIWSSGQAQDGRLFAKHWRSCENRRSESPLSATHKHVHAWVL